MTIPLFRTKIYQESIDNVVATLQSGWLGLGPRVEEFEKAFCNYIGCKYAVAVNSGTAALQLAMELLDLPRGSRMISTPLTFVATNHEIIRRGVDPVFADTDMTTGNADLDSIRRLCRLYGVGEHNTNRPRAIMVVHYGGTPIPIDFLYEIGEEYRVPIVEDCAHACGSFYRGEMVGQRARLACFSFHAVKSLVTGDGGMLTTNDEELAERARKLRWFGINKSTADRSKNGYGWEYTVEELGYKLHMNDINASIGLGQLKHLDEDISQRHRFFTWYRGEGLNPLYESPHAQSTHHLIVILAKDAETKKKIVDHLAKNDIQTGCHYLPNYYYKMYKECIKENNCRRVEEFYSRCITLPNYIGMTREDVRLIGEKIREVENE
jgi:perosamine synthetase